MFVWLGTPVVWLPAYTLWYRLLGLRILRYYCLGWGFTDGTGTLILNTMRLGNLTRVHARRRTLSRHMPTTPTGRTDSCSTRTLGICRGLVVMAVTLTFIVG